MDVGGRSHSMEHFRAAIDADVGFMPKTTGCSGGEARILTYSSEREFGGISRG